MSLWFTMVFSKWQFPMLPTCAVNISISTSLVCIYTKSIRRQWDDTYLVWRYLMMVPVFWSSPQHHPAPRFSALPETKVTSLGQGHISWSRSYLLIKVISIDQVLIYDNQSSSHLFIEVTSIYQCHIYDQGHIYLSKVTSIYNGHIFISLLNDML